MWVLKLDSKKCSNNQESEARLSQGFSSAKAHWWADEVPQRVQDNVAEDIRTTNQKAISKNKWVIHAQGWINM